MLGYRNIENQFTPGIITTIAYEAMKHPDKPYFFCLDEMNLARVEYYFSDILSLMGTRHFNENGEIVTDTLLGKEQFGRDEGAFSKYGDVYIPHNLYMVSNKNCSGFCKGSDLWVIKNIKTVKRRDIKEIPKDSEEDYYVIEVEGWEELERKIEVSGYQVIKILYTTEFLLKNAKIVTELCIKSKEEYRLWQELRRINSQVYTKGEQLIGNDSKVNGFSIGGIDVIVTKDEIVVGKDRASFTRADFNKRPRVVMQEMLKIL